jgi:hypothetical protein
VLVLAVQNAVEYENLGVATSTATLFRSMGGTVGVPIFGAIFANRLSTELARRLPPEVAARIPSRLGPSQVDALPPPIRDAYVEAYSAAIRPIFLIAAGIAALGFLVTWLLQERPLRETVADQGIGDSFASPREATSMAELETRLSALASRQRRHLVYERLTERAGLDVSAPDAWLLFRLGEHEAGDDAALAAGLGAPGPELVPLLAGLRARGLVEPDAARLTPAGADAAARLDRARREAVQALLEDWEPERHPEVLDLVRRFARSLSAAPPALEPAAT